MTDLQRASSPTTEAFLAEAGPRLADLCTGCGACFQACPMADYAGLRSEDAGLVTGGLKLLAMGQPGPDATVKWVGSCGKSGLCVSACPEAGQGLDAMLLIRIARQRAINDTKQLAGKADPTAFPRVKVFARLQLTDEELKAWL